MALSLQPNVRDRPMSRNRVWLYFQQHSFSQRARTHELHFVIVNDLLSPARPFLHQTAYLRDVWCTRTRTRSVLSLRGSFLRIPCSLSLSISSRSRSLRRNACLEYIASSIRIILCKNLSADVACGSERRMDDYRGSRHSQREVNGFRCQSTTKTSQLASQSEGYLAG